MAENLHRYLAGLEVEQAAAKSNKNKDLAAEIGKQIAAAKKAIKAGPDEAETAVEEPAETPEDK